jgi:hypothetical protein
MVQENDFMELNRKLTQLLKGRTIQSESGDEGHVAITFDDQSTLKLKVAGQATVSVGAKVEAVHEAGEHFQVDLEEGSSVQVQLCRSGIVGGVARQKRRGPIPRLIRQGARKVVAIIRCHLEWKGNTVSHHLLPRREDSGILLRNRVVLATHFQDNYFLRRYIY